MKKVIAVLLLSLLGMSAAQAADSKHYSGGNCAPFTTGMPNYNELRFRPDGVQNQSTGYRYVICPIVRDSEADWGSGEADYIHMYAQLRGNAAGNFQCTLTVGSTTNGSFSKTQSADAAAGETVTLFWDSINVTETGVLDHPATIVCRLPPKGTLAMYNVIEETVTDLTSP